MLGWISECLGSNGDILVKMMFGEKMIGSDCQFLWCKYSHSGLCRTFNLTLLNMGLERDEHHWFL